ncbi:methyltransferase [Granulicella sp. S156]|uniref:methyltransferase n=1 Tax=Granulicella sp. S156 TaxID=1747224 RepID=UPI00352A9E80
MTSRRLQPLLEAMPKLDAIYTPAPLAASIVRKQRRLPSIVADFACGHGELLKAAASKWNHSKIVGVDVSRSAVACARRNLPAAEIGCCDFLSARSRRRCATLHAVWGQVDLILLNPPFSCRGGTRLAVDTDLFRTSCSVAMSFVLHAFEYLSKTGEIVAILPAGCLSADKDREAWELLRLQSTVKVLSDHDHRTFDSCSPRTFVVRIKRGRAEKTHQVKTGVGESAGRYFLAKVSVIIRRGTIQMHSSKTGNTPLVHSTELLLKRVDLSRRTAFAGSSSAKSPFVAICRVGSPRQEKVALHRRAGSVIAISDCVIALECVTAADALWLHTQMLDRWEAFEALYQGTGAKYTTVRRVADFLAALGCEVEIGKNRPPSKRRIEKE